MRHDAIIIGGGFAGLSAAMYIARARRSVAIVDTGLPRNRFAAQSHGFFAQDGSAPGAMLATARAQVAAYPTAAFVAGEAIGATREPDGFALTLASGEVLTGRRLVLAFGLSDELPALPGLAERWGASVIHCPYCHGYEFSGRRLGVLHLSEQSLHMALLVTEWGPTTLYLNGGPPPDDATLAELERRGVAIEPAPVRALHGPGAELRALELGDGRMSDIDVLYIGPPTRLNSAIAEQLGCALEDGTFGPVIRTDATKMTTVPDVYAVGHHALHAHRDLGVRGWRDGGAGRASVAGVLNP